MDFGVLRIFDDAWSKTKKQKVVPKSQEKRKMLENEWDVDFFLTTWEETDNQLNSKRLKTETMKNIRSQSDDVNRFESDEFQIERSRKILHVLSSYQKQGPKMLQSIQMLSKTIDLLCDEMGNEVKSIDRMIDRCNSL